MVSTVDTILDIINKYETPAGGLCFIKSFSSPNGISDEEINTIYDRNDYINSKEIKNLLDSLSQEVLEDIKDQMQVIFQYSLL